MRRWIAIAVVVPWAAWAIGRTLGLDRGHPLIAMVAFTPYAAFTAPVAIAVALALRRWGAAAVALAAAVLLALAIVPRSLGDGASASKAPTVTVMTSNMQFGEADPARLVAVARRYDVDVLFLEELTPEGLDRLEDAGIGRTLRHQAVEPRTGGAGNGILSRYRLRRIPGWELPNEPAVDIAVPGSDAPLRVRVVHPRPPVRRDSAAIWREHLRSLPSAPDGPAVLAGDFNATLDHRALRQVLDRGWRDAADETGDGLKPTWPVGRRILGLTIDHVLVGTRLRVRATHVHEIPETDHRAVVAELAIARSS